MNTTLAPVARHKAPERSGDSATSCSTTTSLAPFEQGAPDLDVGDVEVDVRGVRQHVFRAELEVAVVARQADLAGLRQHHPFGPAGRARGEDHHHRHRRVGLAAPRGRRWAAGLPAALR